MIHSTIRDAWLHKIDTKGHTLYIFRDDDETVLYVGRSSYPLDRLRSHLSTYSSNGGSGKLAQLLRACLPRSLEWPLEFLSPDDWNTLTQQYDPEQYNQFQRNKNGYSGIAEEIAEKILIQYYRLCFNFVTRAEAYTPPAKYVSLLSALPKTDAEVQKKPIQQWIYETMNSSSDNREELDALVKTLLEQQKQLEQRVDSLEKRLEMLEYATRMTS